MEPPQNQAQIIELRALLRAQFPTAHAVERPKIKPSSSSGVSCLDQLCLDRGCLTEVVGAQASTGAVVLLAGLLDHTLRQRRPAALIDTQDSFDPLCLPKESRHRLLWVRTHHRLDDSLRAVDLLLRDGNLPLVILDLLGTAVREVQRVPGSVWFRLRTLCEQSGAVFLALTPCKTIPCAQRRLETVHRFGIDEIDLPLITLLASLHLHTLLERTHPYAAAERPARAAA